MKSRRFAWKYSSIVPCRSRWSWLRLVKTSASNRTRSSRRNAAPCDDASTAALRSPASSISRKRRWSSIASGVVNGAGRRSPPTIHSTVPTSPGARPPASSIECSRNVVVVFPFVPVTPASSSSRVGSPKNTSAATAIAARASGDDELRDVDLELSLDDERDGAALDRRPGEVVPVDDAPRNAEEQRPGVTVARVVGEVADDDRPGSGHLAGGERPDQGLQLHA